MASDKTAGKPSVKGGKSYENVLGGFQALRLDQRMLAGKLSEMELECNEHK